MRLVIDVQPDSASFLCRMDRFSYQPPPDATSLKFGMNSGIEQEGMDSAIPGQVYKTDEKLIAVGADVGQAASQNRPESSGGMIRPCSGE